MVDRVAGWSCERPRQSTVLGGVMPTCKSSGPVLRWASAGTSTDVPCRNDNITCTGILTEVETETGAWPLRPTQSSDETRKYARAGRAVGSGTNSLGGVQLL
jgi:hypothetical protein